MPAERSEEITLLADSLRRFMEREIVPTVDAVDHFPTVPAPDGFHDNLVASLGGLGLLSVAAGPEAEGGMDADPLEILAAASEVMGEIYASVPAILLAHALAQQLLLRYGTPDQRHRWLRSDPERGRPPLLAFPLYLEPDADGLELRGERDENGALCLGGSCNLVVNGPIADGLVLPVRREDGLGLVALEPCTPGLSLGPPVLTLGFRGCPVCDVSAAGVVVSKDGSPGGPEPISLREAYAEIASPVASLCAGIGSGSLKAASAYLAERRQGGHRLLEYSHLRRMIAGMASRCEVARSAAAQITRSGGCLTPAALALFITAREGVARATQDGVQLLGGYGYMEDYGQERRMRDAKQAQLMLGRDALRELELAGTCLE